MWKLNDSIKTTSQRGGRCRGVALVCSWMERKSTFDDRKGRQAAKIRISQQTFARLSRLPESAGIRAAASNHLFGIAVVHHVVAPGNRTNADLSSTVRLPASRRCAPLATAGCGAPLRKTVSKCQKHCGQNSNSFFIQTLKSQFLRTPADYAAHPQRVTAATQIYSHWQFYLQPVWRPLLIDGRFDVGRGVTKPPSSRSLTCHLSLLDAATQVDALIPMEQGLETQSLVCGQEVVEL
jgi:hypothetical protein